MKRTSFLRRTLRLVFTLAGVAAMTAPTGVAGAAGHAPPAGGEGRSQGCVVVYLDLGETLLHTAEDGSMAYMPEAAEYLRDLRDHHVPVGLITNIPPSWGATDAERAAELKRFVNEGWSGPQPFAWSDFGDRIFTPRTEAESKPAPALFERARDAAGDCRVVFEGESAAEVEASAALGFVAYQAHRPSWPRFLPVPVITTLGHLPHRNPSAVTER